MGTDSATKELEMIELEYQLDSDAMVSCTPYLNAKPVLPTLEVPYADRMQWEWEIHQRIKIDKVVVVAKTEHYYSLQAHPRRGDTLVFYLMAQDLNHGH